MTIRFHKNDLPNLDNYQVDAVAIDTETTSLDEMQADLVGISLCPDVGLAAYVPLAHVEGAADLFGGGQRAEGQIPMDQALAMLKPMLEDPAVEAPEFVHQRVAAAAHGGG